MPIPVQCQCGQTLNIPEAAAGASGDCPHCGSVFNVPTLEELGHQAPEQDPSLQKELEHYREASSSAAARPGMIRPSVLRFYYNFPIYFIIMAIPGIVLIVLGLFLHWVLWAFGLGLLIMFSLHSRKIRIQFVSGNINPGVVVSTSPPLIAVVGNLSFHQNMDWPVIQILPHPLSRMTGGPFKVGDRLATVAVYYPGQGGSHYLHFEPVAVNCVTGKASQIERMMQSIEEEEWKEIESGLAQVPKPYKAAQYQIDLDPPHDRDPDRITPFVVANLVGQIIRHDPQHGLCDRRGGIPPKDLKRMLSKIGPAASNLVPLAMVYTPPKPYGMLLTETHLVFNVTGLTPRAIPWEDVKSAFFHEGVFEIVLHAGYRYRLPKKILDEGSLWRVELAINAIANEAYLS